jgi:hypothetical protein
MLTSCEVLSEATNDDSSYVNQKLNRPVTACSKELRGGGHLWARAEELKKSQRLSEKNNFTKFSQAWWHTCNASTQEAEVGRLQC